MVGNKLVCTMKKEDGSPPHLENAARQETGVYHCVPDPFVLEQVHRGIYRVLLLDACANVYFMTPLQDVLECFGHRGCGAA
jgi:hypothetical protein